MDSKAMQNEPIFSESELRDMHPDDYDRAFVKKVTLMRYRRSSNKKVPSVPLFASLPADEIREQYTYNCEEEKDAEVALTPETRSSKT